MDDLAGGCCWESEQGLAAPARTAIPRSGSPLKGLGAQAPPLRGRTRQTAM